MASRAHIHCGPSDPASLRHGSTPAHLPRLGAACPGGIATLADLLAKIRSGGAYTNVHTIQWPAGEIRGDIR